LENDGESKKEKIMQMERIGGEGGLAFYKN
jgi:hypothetical protein